MDELTRYGPIGLAMVAVAILIATYPGFLGLPRERVRPTLLIYIGAFVLFVVLDVISGQALTSITDLPRAAAVLLSAVFVLAIANLVYLVMRHPHAPR
jgi:predicted membrane-bound dolichyl-phosphate-mannose-protein mannosyltransferase